MMRASQEPSGLVLIVEDNRNISEMVGEYLELFAQLVFEPLAQSPLREYGGGGSSPDVWSPTRHKRK